jgi:type IV pilus assembly protein PilW
MSTSPRMTLRTRQTGLSLVELLVAIAISMLLMAVIASVLVSAESNKRTMTSTNDLDQSGDYAGFILDGWLRGAGSGFAPAASYTYGCPLYAKLAGVTVSPLTPPSPFASISSTIRLAPLIIAPDKTSPAVSNAVTTGHTSDVLIVMGGADGGSSVLSLVTAQPTSTTLTLNNTLGFNAGNIVLVADQPDSSANMAACVVSQVASPTTGGSAYTSLTLSTASTGYGAGAYGTTYIANMSAQTEVMNLGNFTNSNLPVFVMIGVGDNNTLYSYDILQTNGSTVSVPLADGVLEMHAVYGVDSASTGAIDSWASPSSGTYAYSALAAGTATAAELLETIKAVRIGLILRSSIREKTAPSTSTSISMFSDLTNSSGTALTFTRTFTGDELYYRYRKVELTIPLRNNRLL